MTVIQTLLTAGCDRMVAWLPRDPRVKPGVEITLTKGAGRWMVSEQWSSMELNDINRRWDVGGL